MPELNFRPADESTCDTRGPDDTGCQCHPGDDKYLLEIEEGQAVLVHAACGKQPPANWGDWHDLVTLAQIPVILSWQQECDGSMWHGMDRCDHGAYIVLEPPLSPDNEHPECGFHWHGRDGMDIPMRDGQPVCPRCELARAEAEVHQLKEQMERWRKTSYQVACTHDPDSTPAGAADSAAPADTQTQTVLCTASILKKPHAPHQWRPQPGMDSIHCPGLAGWEFLPDGQVTEGLTAADDPTQLRWGLNDTLWGDDDTVTVMLSGPAGEPYWLELDQEPAAVLRQDLAGPDGDAQQDGPDTLPAWLYQRFAVIHGAPAWDTVAEGDRSYWGHQAEAVRRAVARNGFKTSSSQPAVEARQERPVVPVHAVPVPGSDGISSCCGRPPCEFVGERVTRDPAAVTCPGPKDSPVAYSGKGRVFCLRCPHPADENVPLTIDHVDTQELCASCGRHVVDVARGED